MRKCKPPHESKEAGRDLALERTKIIIKMDKNEGNKVK